MKTPSRGVARRSAGLGVMKARKRKAPEEPEEPAGEGEGAVPAGTKGTGVETEGEKETVNVG